MPRVGGRIGAKRAVGLEEFPARPGRSRNNVQAQEVPMADAVLIFGKAT